jgi:hypothetical protein
MLLQIDTCSRRSGRMFFEHAMHPFMATILLRFARFNPLRHDPQPDPPFRKLGNSARRSGGKRDSIVHAHSPGQAVLTEKLFEFGLGLFETGARKIAAAQYKPVCMVHDRQLVAPAPITGSEATFKISGPFIIRPRTGEKGCCMEEPCSGSSLGLQSPLAAEFYRWR